MGYNPLINGVYWGYSPLTNHLLTSWDTLVDHLSHEKNLGCLGYIGDEILPRNIGHDNKPLEGSLSTNQDSMESRRVFFVAHLEVHGVFNHLRLVVFSFYSTIL